MYKALTLIYNSINMASISVANQPTLKPGKPSVKKAVKQKQTVRRAVSLFTGAGGMDVGFKKAGFSTVWANDILEDACKTYTLNHKNIIRCGDINSYLDELSDLNNIEIVFGGPPCQGFSVAGKMDPNDERSKLLFSFFDVVERVQPQAFVLENVKALGSLKKWKPVREEMFKRAYELGYEHVELIILNATDFGVPQKRERMFLIGVKKKNEAIGLAGIEHYLSKYKKSTPPVGEFLKELGPAGSSNNASLCSAKITLAKNPILRASAYSGMLFNGAGRPIDPKGYSNTLPASMGGNRTPIVDDQQIFQDKKGWVEKYFTKLKNGEDTKKTKIPSRLRRITVEEAAIIQSFPKKYKFHGKQSSKYLQIGNAVPCDLAFAVGSSVRDYIDET